MTDFKPPEMTHVVIDIDLQMQKYLADIAMEDILLSPPMSARRERPDGLMAQYRRVVSEVHAIEKANDAAIVTEDVSEYIGTIAYAAAEAHTTAVSEISKDED